MHFPDEPNQPSLEPPSAMADGAACTGVWHGSVAYDGSRFHGWQIQANARTVQGEIASRLQRLLGCPDLRLAGTSRTDAGVHALDQHFSFPDLVPGRFAPAQLAFLLERWLPDDLQLTSLELVSSDFHARHDACGKAYTYAIHPGPGCSPFARPFVWPVGHALCLETMRQAAELFVGTHDFTAFAANSKQAVDNPVKTIHRLEVVEHGGGLYVNVVGNSFLYKMVRSIVGYLVGRAGRAPDWSAAELTARLASGQRDAAVQTAPPQGLFLAKVFFQTDQWQTYVPLLPPHHR